MSGENHRLAFPRNWKRSLMGVQILLCGIGLGLFLWNGINLLKIQLFGEKDFGMYPWTFIFFHPIESSLINYLSLALLFGICAALLYFSFHSGRLPRWLALHEQEPAWRGVLLLAFSAALFGFIWLVSGLMLKMVGSLLLTLIPLAPRLRLGFDRPLPTRFLLIAIAALLAYEPLAMVLKPVYLMNDYPDVYSETYIKGKLVHNLAFLQKIQEKDIESVKVFYDLLNQLEGRQTEAVKHEDIDFLFEYKNRNLESVQKFMLNLTEAEDFQEIKWMKKGYRDTGPMIRNLKNVDLEAIRQFFLKNQFENNHQNMGRGQVNHIGHVLNPINEYNLGKPTRDIYFQYGMGFTFLKKWVMELWGGVFLHHYYKTYLFYILYSLLFLALLIFLFRDPSYILAAFSILLICFYFLGYLGFFIAPGIIPSIHLFDTSALLCFLLFLRSRKGAFLGGAILLVLISTWININFGMALSLSLFLGLLLYALENEAGRKRVFLILLSLFQLLLNLAVVKAASTSDFVFYYYLMGYLSWPAKNFIILCTMAYLAVSYGFLILIKNQRFYLKYIYLFILIYSQIILTYYFWSGLTSHLPPVISFAWMQLILTLHMLKEHVYGGNPRVARGTDKAIHALIVLCVFLLLMTGQKFYSEKKVVTDNFRDHKAHQWELDRARVISTLPPEPFQNTIALIQRYSEPKNPRVYFLAKYDGMIPFLANRYSAMPTFEMTGYIFSPRELEEAKKVIAEAKPPYLFVDRNIASTDKDPWAVLYRNPPFRNERASRFERYALLAKVFMEFREEYERIDESGLISVYKRKIPAG